MESAYDSYIRYKNARNVFALKTYVILFVWLILALIQWSIICLVEEARDVFQNHYYISFVTFSLAVLLFGVFIFFESLRYINFLNFLISFIIVELQIISVFAVVVYCHWTEVLSFYGMCFVLLWVFILIGTFLPKEIDLTLDVAVLFILGFIFLIIAVYFVMIRFVLVSDEIYPYIIIEIAISIIILFFVMYHAQTIIGSRFAEMRLNDALLGSLILFHDFLILYWLTFYWQILERPITPDSWLMTSTSTEDTMQTRHPNMRHVRYEDYEEYENKDPDLIDSEVEQGGGHPSKSRTSNAPTYQRRDHDEEYGSTGGWDSRGAGRGRHSNPEGSSAGQRDNAAEYSREEPQKNEAVDAGTDLSRADFGRGSGRHTDSFSESADNRVNSRRRPGVSRPGDGRVLSAIDNSEDSERYDSSRSAARDAEGGETVSRNAGGVHNPGEDVRDDAASGGILYGGISDNRADEVPVRHEGMQNIRVGGDESGGKVPKEVLEEIPEASPTV
ncbi:GH25311, isoform A [Drosophila grimshawi]|uniref:GH25311, isoform A n=1 Tax=Drosophila grimshawi TaxID=7222 RepID=B4J039_DROGR|nr:GH25311, isoform A [Drosophila grimshawi]